MGKKHEKHSSGHQVQPSSEEGVGSNSMIPYNHYYNQKCTHVCLHNNGQLIHSTESSCKVFLLGYEIVQ